MAESKKPMDLMQGRFYPQPMRTLILIAVLATTQPAFAMNWEGHDDWMKEFPPAQAFIDAVPETKPLPPRDCPMEPIARSDNPYEQIALPPHRCPLPQPDKLPER